MMNDPTWLSELEDAAATTPPTDFAAMRDRVHRLYHELQQHSPLPGTYLYDVSDHQWITLDKRTTTLGRQASSSIQIKRSWVSNRHCEITCTDDTWQLHDRQSTNGTRLNDRKIDVATLHSGDKISVDRSQFFFI